MSKRFKFFSKIKRNAHLDYGQTFRHDSLKELEVDVFVLDGKLIYPPTETGTNNRYSYYYENEWLQEFINIHPNDFDEEHFNLLLLKKINPLGE